MKKKIAIFASGSGSNAEKICEYFKSHTEITVDAIYSNKPKAGVFKRADNFNIDSFLIKDQLSLIELLKERQTDLIALAGYLKLIPSELINAFPKRIINIHPALLPKYGGKGMYGQHIHKAVLENGDEESGLSIHFVNEVYDEGKIIFQTRVQINKEDTAEEIGKKVLAKEHYYYPRVLEQLLLEQ